MSLLKSIQFLLSVPDLMCNRTSAVSDISIDPQFTEYREKRGKGRDRETRIEYKLDGDEFERRSGPGDGAGVHTSRRVDRSRRGSRPACRRRWSGSGLARALIRHRMLN